MDEAGIRTYPKIKAMLLWNLIDKKLLDPLSGNASPVQSLCFHPVSGFLLAGSEDGTISTPYLVINIGVI